MSLPEGEGCVLQVVMSAKRLEEGLGLAPGQLPQSLVDGKELVLLLVRFGNTVLACSESNCHEVVDFCSHSSH